MRCVCSECGREIPDESDFCYVCGSLRTKAVEIHDAQEIMGALNLCHVCGGDMRPEDPVCKKCGEPRVKRVVISVGLDRYGTVAILLALIPGALALLPGLISVFGLGHLMYKRWTRAAMFLTMSALLGMSKMYADEGGMQVIIILATAVTFFVQLMEVTALAMFRRKPQ
ncbi:MAG: zinc ribbon domain-containing protein [Candidatus Methanoplasma sp.]|jgi:hypothetical protein|nr:zinc ribbon domain-containing protein [Candidatus Methanoplasma sp.]